MIAAAIAAAVVAAAATAYGTYNQYEQQKKQADYNAKVADVNAAQARQAAESNAIKQRDRYQRLLSTQRALYGASGAEVDVGSPLLLEMDTAKQGELDAQRMLWEGLVRSNAFENEARYNRWAKRSAASQQWINTIISGVASGASTYSSVSSKGSSPSASANTGGNIVPATYGGTASDAGARIPRYAYSAGGY